MIFKTVCSLRKLLGKESSLPTKPDGPSLLITLYAKQGAADKGPSFGEEGIWAAEPIT